MWRLTSSEPEIDSLIAVPSSCRSCLILSSTRSPSGTRKLLQSQQLTFTCAARIIQNGTARGQYSESNASGVHSLSPVTPAAASSGPIRSPQLRPVREVLPASPLRVAPQHRRVAHLPAAVVG